MSNPRYVIRQVAGSAHESVILGLQHLTFPNDDVVPVSRGMWWLAWHKGNPVAVAGAYPCEGWSSCLYVSRTGVLADHRGRGLQGRLLDVCMRKARALGMSHVISTTYCNPVSSNNFIDRGFRLYSPAQPWGADGTNYWIKEL
jgi:GNAT superfamily N-acetyltransferase